MLNIECLKNLIKQNESLFNKIDNKNEINESYMYKDCLIGNSRRHISELNYVFVESLIDETSYDLELGYAEKTNKTQEIENKTLMLLKEGDINEINFDFTDLTIESFMKCRQTLNLHIEDINHLFEHKTLSSKKYLFNLFETIAEHPQFSASRNNMHPSSPLVQTDNTNFKIENNSIFLKQSTTLNKFNNNINSSNISDTNDKNLFAKPQLPNTTVFQSSFQNNSNVFNNCNNKANDSNNGSILATSNKFSALRYEPRISKCYKRKNNEDNEMTEEYDSNDREINNQPFKSAKEQLIIDNNKTQQNSSNVHSNGFNYSLPKRPMNANLNSNTSININNPPPKKGIHSKFNLPLRNNDEDKSNNNNNSGGFCNSAELNADLANIDMSKMKNVEPKLIEIIASEVMDRTPQITWDDIAGLEFVKKTIKEIVIWPLLRPDIFNGLRGPPKGLLLFGPPGTGKTLIAKCIANESKSTFFNISSSTLTSKWQGESEKLVKVLFEVARACQPSVIFIDEIDSLLSQRSDEDRESSRRLKTEFFVQMDGCGNSTDERILLIGATNRPQELDDAARRRFVKRLYIPLPEETGRSQIIRNLIKKQLNSLNEEEIIRIAELTDGYSGADMTNLCRESALGPIRSLENI